MPPPSLSTTTITRSMPRCGGAEEAVAVVEEGEVADEQRGRARVVAERDADGGRHDAVDAVGAAVGVDRELVVRTRRTTRGRGSASTTTPPARRRPGGCGPGPGRRAGSDGPCVVEHAVDRAARGVAQARATASAHAPPSTGSTAGVSAAHCSTTASAVHGSTTAAVPWGSTHRGPAATICTAPVRGQPLVGDPRGQRPAEVHDQLGAEVGLGAEQRVEPGDGHRRTPHGRGGRREHRPAERRRRSARRSRADRSRPRPRSARGGRPGRRRGRPPSPAAARRTVATPTRPRSGGAAAARRACRPAARGTRGRGGPGPGWVPVASAWARAASARHRSAAASSATPGAWNQRTDRPKRWVWSMACGAPTSWSSGGRLAVHTSSGTPARSASTTAGCSSTAAVPLVVSTTTASPDAAARPEGEEAAAALVVVDVDGDAVVGGQRERQRRRPRAGADDGVLDAVARPLVDEGGAEGGLQVLGSRRHGAAIRPHPVCQDPRHVPARRAPGRRAHGSCWSTASPRPAAAGGPWSTPSPPTTRSCWSTRPATAGRRRSWRACAPAAG